MPLGAANPYAQTETMGDPVSPDVLASGLDLARFVFGEALRAKDDLISELRQQIVSLSSQVKL
ncbi:MAG TPA: hypothetical protein VMK12_07115 [Anaeromyxobacteraceae bacterium]|nr:hypothetical protein [Anaeromyxobacteraceae bacterium]